MAAQLEFDAAAAGSCEPVDGGVLLLTPAYSVAWELNKVRLDPGADARAVARAVEIAEERLDGFAHRRVMVPLPAEEVVAPEGWQREVLLLLTWSGPPPAWPDAVRDIEAGDLLAARLADGWPHEVAHLQEPFDTASGARALGLFEDGETRAWCVLHGGAIDDVWVVEAHRGRGLGRAITSAAVAAGGWFLLCDEADPRPQGLYRSLGFEDAGHVVNLTRRYVAAP